MNTIKKVTLLFSAMFFIFFLTACSETASPNSEDDGTENAQSEEAPADKQEESETQEKTETTEATEAEEPEKQAEAEETEPVQPYIPLEPEEGIEPLKDKLSEEEVNMMPEAQANGGDRTRMVPLNETLVKGAEDKTDGPLKNHRLVAYYGHPNSVNMGILGQMEPEAFMEKLKEQTQAYSNADPSRPAIPTIELIATVAHRDPGPDGNYVTTTSSEQIDEYAKLAEEHGALLMLDIQLGTDTVMNEVKRIEKWLKLPHVHLAIDTEYQVGEGQTPGIDLGQVNGAEIQEAIDYLTKMVDEHNLPDKVVFVHQFTEGVLTNKQAIHPTENVEVALNFDGWGYSAAKMSNYRAFVRDEAVQYGGFKVFYDKDEPVMSAEEVLQLDPSPAVINYQ